MRRDEITVLIVEDSAFDVETIVKNLTSHSEIPLKNIKNTDDTREALAMIKINEPTIIFVDGYLSSSGFDKGDGFLLLKEIHETYKNNSYYDPYIIAVSSHMSLEIQKSVAPFCNLTLNKNQHDYPQVAFNRFLMEKGIAFQLPKVKIEETEYMSKVYILIEGELSQYNFSALKQIQQNCIKELICLIIPTLDNRTIKLEPLYKEVANKFDASKFRSVKTTINRGFNILLQTDDFFKIYNDIHNSKEGFPDQKTFFTYIATLVKNKL